MSLSKSGAKMFCFSFEGRAFNILGGYPILVRCTCDNHAKIIVGTSFHHSVKMGVSNQITLLEISNNYFVKTGGMLSFCSCFLFIFIKERKAWAGYTEY